MRATREPRETTTTNAPTRAEPTPRGEGEASAPAFHALDREELESRLETGPHGLTDADVGARIARAGPNELDEVSPPSVLSLLLRQFKSPLIYILLLAALVTLALAEYVDAGVIGAVLVLNAVIGFAQERKAEISVRALMQLVSPRARVIRDGREEEVESRLLVPGDLVLLESGVRIPADLRLVSSVALAIDESSLTGESLPVTKHARRLEPGLSLADRGNMAYTGTVVTRGRGRGYVVATGTSTELGGIAGQMREEERVASPLQQRMDRFSRIVSGVVAVASVGGFLLGIVLGHSPADMFMLAVALAVAAIPEGLPVVLTITLAVGVRRMAKRHAIIRRLPAVETLGSTTVIGSDKTGTLTENRMTVEEVWASGETYPVLGDRVQLKATPEASALLRSHPTLSEALLAGVLANEAEVYVKGGSVELHGDPTESALLVAAARMGIDYEEEREAYAIFAEIPFESERQYSASIRKRDERYHVFVKGAPERVLAMCKSLFRDDGEQALSEQHIHAVHDAEREMASRGLRVLAMAKAEHPRAPHGPEEVKEPEALGFLGLVGMMDPPREGVREAILGCQRSGLRVVMITGDHAATAQAIGASLGIAEKGAEVLTGSDLAEMDDERLRLAVKTVSLFARVAPEQKLRVVWALQSHGEVVAVTGDGVNDAPALKAADIGVAMGKSGTDVAREAADMVLADDNFVSIYAAVEEGRITFDNLRKATFFLISTAAATVITILSAMAAGWPIPFVPAQLLWLNLVTNGLQDVALAFEPGERGVLERAPRKRGESIISRLLWERTVVAGVVMAAGTLFLFQWELQQSGSLARAQTVALTTMVVFQVFHAGNSRSEHLSVFAKSPFSNLFLFLATAASISVHLAALNLAPTQFVLRLEPLLDVGVWLRIVGVAASILVAMELHKLIRRERKRPPAALPTDGR